MIKQSKMKKNYLKMLIINNLRKSIFINNNLINQHYKFCFIYTTLFTTSNYKKIFIIL